MEEGESLEEAAQNLLKKLKESKEIDYQKFIFDGLDGSLADAKGRKNSISITDEMDWAEATKEAKGGAFQELLTRQFSYQKILNLFTLIL